MNRSRVHTYRQYNRVATYCVVAATLIFLGCQSGERQSEEASDPEVPERIDTLENLNVFSPEDQPHDTVEFIQEQVFESNEEVFLNGYISEIAVDDNDRVYIEAGNMGNIAIYVFESDGSYVTTLGGYGRGPGEFLAITDMSIENHQLYVFDHRQRKITVFSLDDFSVSDEMILQKDAVANDMDLAQMRPTGGFLVQNDGTILIKYESNNQILENRKIRFYQLDEEAAVLPELILELQDNRRYFEAGAGVIVFAMPFNRSSLVGMSDRDSIYTAWTEDFLIKVHGPDGNYERAIYYPVPKSSLDMGEIDRDRNTMSIVEKTETPETWPALHNMIIDDQNRLWMFSITDSDSTYQGWVLNSEGELLAKFDWPGSRQSRNPQIPPFSKIKNGYFYVVEVDIPEEVNRVVKHRIEFREQ